MPRYSAAAGRLNKRGVTDHLICVASPATDAGPWAGAELRRRKVNIDWAFWAFLAAEQQVKELSTKKNQAVSRISLGDKLVEGAAVCE